MPVTLTDIAERLNVAKSTVSLVLRDHPISQKFNEPLRQRIKETARQMNYRPNLFASGLSGKQSRILMLCLSYLQDYWASMIASAFEHEASQRGYRVLISAFHDQEDPLTFNRDILGPQGVQAMAVVGSTSDKFTDHSLNKLADEGMHIALVGRAIDDSRICQVLADNDQGVGQVAEHLYSQHLDSTWVLTTAGQGSVSHRAAAFQAQAKRLGKPAPQLFEINSKHFISASYETIQSALDQFPPPQALFACGDVLALGAVRAFHERKIQVGKDVAVVGFDGCVFSEASNPVLTTVIQPMAQMGRQAAGALIEMVENKNADARPKQIILPTELSIGESSVLKRAKEPSGSGRAGVSPAIPARAGTQNPPAINVGQNVGRINEAQRNTSDNKVDAFEDSLIHPTNPVIPAKAGIHNPVYDNNTNHQET